MPPRATGLDAISQAIGRLEGSIKSIETYVHEERHGSRNLAQKVDALSTQITREVTRMKAEIQVQLESMDKRVASLEAIAAKEAGERGLMVGLLHSPLVGWLVGGAAIVWAAVTGRGQ